MSISFLQVPTCFLADTVPNKRREDFLVYSFTQCHMLLSPDSFIYVLNFVHSQLLFSYAHDVAQSYSILQSINQPACLDAPLEVVLFFVRGRLVTFYCTHSLYQKAKARGERSCADFSTAL
jgi:hypothetical protein